jgi:hypothetical protein
MHLLDIYVFIKQKYTFQKLYFLLTKMQSDRIIIALDIYLVHSDYLN